MKTFLLISLMLFALNEPACNTAGDDSKDHQIPADSRPIRPGENPESEIQPSPARKEPQPTFEPKEQE